MKDNIKKGLPYVVAILLFLSLTILYFAPVVFEGKDLPQGDVNSVQGWGRDLKDYHTETGEYAFWSNSMFSGMPANYTFMPPFLNVFSYFYKALASVLPLNHMLPFFLYFLGFYIFMLALGCRSWLSVVGAVAYALATFNLVSITAGHVNKCLVMATMAPIIGGIILCYRKQYLWGIIVTLIFTGLNIYWSHQQISYYLLIIIIVLAITYLIYAIKEHTLKDYFKSSAILVVVALLAIAPELGSLISTADYSKDTMRGGTVLQNNAEGKKENAGLEIDYAFYWSYGKGETMTLLIPNFYGSSSSYDIGTDSEYYKFLQRAGYGGQAAQYSKYAPMYWGDQQGGTSGPVYVGAIICFLFILGIIIVKGPEKWWLLVATIISFILSWGYNAGINEFLFYHLPLYNKFRTPSMALVMAEVTVATMAILALKEVFSNKENRDKYLRPIYISAGITGGLCLIYALFGGSLMSFTGAADAKNYANMPELLDALIADRKQMLSSDAWRSFIFIAFAAATLWYYIRKPFKVTYVIAILGILIFVDLWTVDKRFLNDENFIAKKKAREIVATEVDKQILQDKDPNYRVFNLTKSPFNESETSYFHKSIGGYSPAKLRRYQDIIDYHFAQGINMNVTNMLNTRYFIVPSQQGPQVQKNFEALGNAWFVNEIEWVNSPDEEIVALKDFDPSQKAFIDAEWKDKLPNWERLQHPRDSSATISLTNYANPGYLIYESHSTRPHLAVFSEVFYKTWHAYIDGQEAPLIQVNYILRGLEIPAGDHKIEFKCIDEIYERGAKISMIASIIVGFILVGLFGYAIWQVFRKKEAIADDH